MNSLTKTIICSLILAVDNKRSLQQLRKDNEMQNVAGIVSQDCLRKTAVHTEALSSLSVPIYGLQVNVHIRREIAEDLIYTNNMPKRIKSLIRDICPHFHFLNRKEDIINGSLTSNCCEIYGCFTTELPFGISKCRSSALLPMCQEEIKTRLYLWTRMNPTNREIVDPTNIETLLCSHFQNHANVVMVIHDYLGAGNISILLEMKDAILNKSDTNFMSVDWMIGARTNYTKAVANGQMVSAVIAYFIQEIMDLYNISSNRFHIIGFGLGAHIAGGIGKRIPGIGRITGLDPIRPFFEGCDSILRLTKSDAMFVDVIHTDIGMIGGAMLSGHLDIYVNGGISQPACFGFSACNHPMALVYFLDSIQSECPYYAYQCESHDSFIRGQCSVNCDSDKSLCAPMGYRADQWKDYAITSPTLMFMLTEERENHCVYHYYLEIECADYGIKMWRYGRNGDKLLVNVIGENGETGQIGVHENSVQYTTSPRVTAVIASIHQIGKIQGIKLKWTAQESQPELPPPPQDCHKENSTENTCCIDQMYEDVEDLCYICPFLVSFIRVRNMETGLSQAFNGTVVRRYEEILFDEKIDFSIR